MLEKMQDAYGNVSVEIYAERKERETQKNLEIATDVIKELNDPNGEKLLAEFNQLSGERDSEFMDTLGRAKEKTETFGKFMEDNDEDLGVYLTKKGVKLAEKDVTPGYDDFTLGTGEYDREFLVPERLERISPKLDAGSFLFLTRRIEAELRREVGVFDRDKRYSSPRRIEWMRENLATVLPFIPEGESKQMSEQLLRESERK